MSMKIGNDTISAIYVGDTVATKVYVGDTLVYEEVETPSE